jgi:hypothetical protein
LRDKVGIQHHTDAIPRPQGSETLWPGNQYGVEACHTNNNDTVYAAVAIWHCLSIQTECLIMYIYVADNTNSKSSVVFKN